MKLSAAPEKAPETTACWYKLLKNQHLQQQRFITRSNKTAAPASIYNVYRYCSLHSIHCSSLLLSLSITSLLEAVFNFLLQLDLMLYCIEDVGIQFIFNYKIYFIDIGGINKQYFSIVLFGIHLNYSLCIGFRILY